MDIIYSFFFSLLLLSSVVFQLFFVAFGHDGYFNRGVQTVGLVKNRTELKTKPTELTNLDTQIIIGDRTEQTDLVQFGSVLSGFHPN